MFTRIRYAFRTAFHKQLTQAQQEAYLNGYRVGFNEGIERGFELGGGFPTPVAPTHAWELVHFVPESPCPGGDECYCDLRPPVNLDQQRPESLDWSINREVE